MSDSSLLLLAGLVDLSALSEEGLLWRSDQLVLDDLSIIEATSDRIVCEGRGIPGVEDVRVLVDPRTGAVLDRRSIPIAADGI